ncbi:MAG: acetylornithine deacetylase/succinyl-diaminopimelate desuccinylase-like protein [Candidatus Azotimanducaceae bacterium]|jgi:acetylornithine deacetylase/succinyl-diaminopimelate desuccinylase-like protein
MLRTKKLMDNLSQFNTDEIKTYIEQYWEDQIIPSLSEYISIPNKSPLFDPDWEKNGYMEDAVSHIMAWVESQSVAGLHAEVHRITGKTPTILLTLEPIQPAENCLNVLIYGHLDKQPEFDGWHADLAPFTPVRKDNLLYGRGGADDGYAIYSAVAALKYLTVKSIAHPRIVILIEASEESGSPDLAAYMDKLEPVIGDPDLVIALDSTCGNYDQLWLTTSLRGMLIADLGVRVLEEGVHSGAAGGIVPSSFRILRQLISRIEDEETGNIKPSFLNDQVPEKRRQEAIEAAKILADSFADMYPFSGDTQPVSSDPVELVLNNTWMPSLAVTGIGGVPEPEQAGNVLRPETRARLALRIPPTTDALEAASQLKALVTATPPNGATVSFDMHTPNPGWHAPILNKKLDQLLNQVSGAFYGKPMAAMGCGGSIPFMEFLAHRSPKAQFVVTGILGPHSNAHGPNEFLHIPAAKKLTMCVTAMLQSWGAT